MTHKTTTYEWVTYRPLGKDQKKGKIICRVERGHIMYGIVIKLKTWIQCDGSS